MLPTIAFFTHTTGVVHFYCPGMSVGGWMPSSLPIQSVCRAPASVQSFVSLTNFHYHHRCHAKIWPSFCALPTLTPPPHNTLSSLFLFPVIDSRQSMTSSTPAAAIPCSPEEKDIVDGLITFLNEAWTSFHAVHASATRLRAAGFIELQEGGAWSLAAGGKYFFTRNMTTIVAFAVGGHFNPAQQQSGSGFTIIGAHTDSPCPKLKPVSKLTKSGYLALSVVGYGGGLWHTWFDRDLTLAGRVLVRQPDGRTTAELVRIDRPILRIPNLAIHLQSDEERRGFAPNLQTQFPPMLASEVKAQLLAATTTAAATTADKKEKREENVGGKKEEGGAESKKQKTEPQWASPDQQHHPLLLQLLAEELGVSVESIVDIEMQLCDTQPSAVGGALREFVFSGRLDNLASSYQALTALIHSCQAPGALDEEVNVRLVALFDHEEIGSMSAQGAASSLLPEVLRRITATVVNGPTGGAAALEDALAQALRRSFIVSADMAHALHPNYDSKHDPGLAPKMHGGLVLKHNVNQRYATNAVTAHVFRELGRRFAKVPFQEFAVKADSRCGSTIGPLVAGLTGVRTVDVGSPQWAMHSVRETMATSDVWFGFLHFKAVLESFPVVAKECEEAMER